MLQAAGIGGLIVAIPLAVRGLSAFGESKDSPGVEMSSFIRIDPDGHVTIVSPSVEMGQGAHTSVAMIVADELGAHWPTIAVINAPIGKAYVVEKQGLQATDGSATIRNFYRPLRVAAATARQLLIEAAAQRWKTDPAGCTARDGHIWDKQSRRKFSFGEIAEAANQLPAPRNVALRERSELRLVAKAVPRMDLVAKVDGRAEFGIDVKLPGMVFAAIRQAPVFGTKLKKVDGTSVLNRPGVIKVVKLKDAVAVVADSFWAAKEAATSLDLTFTEAPSVRPSHESVLLDQKVLLQSGKAGLGIGKDFQTSAEAPGRRVVSATYDVQFLYHAPLETMNCTVHLTPTKCELWLPHQSISMIVAAVKSLTNFSDDAIVVHQTLLGGGFGRKFETDVVEQAVLIAREVDVPVQLVWTREEDVQHGYYRPALSARLEARLGTDGTVDQMVLRAAGPSILEHTTGSPLVNGVDPIAMMGISTETENAPGLLQQYSISPFRAEYVFQKISIPVGYFRSVGAGPNGFFIESFIDELAHEAQEDAIAFRRRLLSDSPRAVVVLDRCVKEAGWDSSLGPGRARGIAFTDVVGSLVCQIAEVSVTKDRLRVEKVTCVIDCGFAVNPDIVRAQIEGGIALGLSATLEEQATFASGAASQSNFHDYPILQLKDMPEISVHIVESVFNLGGVGEAGVPGIAPAVCNAIFAATGRRIRSLPVRSQWQA